MGSDFIKGILIGAFAGPLALAGLIIAVILLIIGIALFVVLGVFAFFGLIFLALAVYLFIKDRNLKKGKSPAVFCLVIGILLILLSIGLEAFGFNFMVDFSDISFIKELHTFIVGE